MTNRDLINACIKGDPLAQRILYEKYASILMSVGYRYAGNKMDAEDIIQESFVKIFRHLRDLQNEKALVSWMKRIVVNTALKLLSKRKSNVENDHFEEAKEMAVACNVISEMSELEILEIVAALPDGYRTVFNMYVIEGYKHKDIAHKLNIEESTSRTQLLKARKLMMKKLSHLKNFLV